MKKFFVLLILVFISISIYALSYNKVILTKDKSEMLKILTTEYSKGIDTLITERIIYERCLIPENLKYYLNDSIAPQIMESHSGIYLLPDSLYPRLTHLFGKDILEVRDLKKGEDGYLKYEKLTEYSVRPQYQFIFWISLFVCIALLILGFIALNLMYSVALSILSTLLFFFYFLGSSDITLLDMYLCMFLLILPAISLIWRVRMYTKRK